MKGLVNWLKKIDRRKYAAPIGVMTKITTARDWGKSLMQEFRQ